MRLCVVGKYPPIEGGVSARTYWIARGLAEGHDVHVVTNADEVEDAYRLRLAPWMTSTGPAWRFDGRSAAPTGATWQRPDKTPAHRIAVEALERGT